MPLLIKNVQLIDGKGRSPQKADILVRGEKVSAIGNFPRYNSKETIDCMGAYLAPGFIDLNTSSDHNLSILNDRYQKENISRGITTIIGGNAGISLAPLLYGSLELIKRVKGHSARVNINWHTFKEFIKTLDKKKLGVNFGTFVGHLTVRNDLVGEDMRNLTPNELEVFKLVLKRAFENGACGLSFDWEYILNNKIPRDEIKSLMAVVGRFGAICSFNLPKGKKELVSSVNEIVGLAKSTGVKTLINNMTSFMPTGKIKQTAEYKEAIALIGGNASNMDISFDLTPCDIKIKEKNYPLEVAVQKITSIPAQKLGLKNRGVVEEGNYADLVIFRDGGIKNVIINGRIVLRDGEYQEISAGKVLKCHHVPRK